MYLFCSDKYSCKNGNNNEGVIAKTDIHVCYAVLINETVSIWLESLNDCNGF